MSVNLAILIIFLQILLMEAPFIQMQDMVQYLESSD